MIMYRKMLKRVHENSLISIFLAFLCTSCTLNIIQTDTHGESSDVADSDPSTDVKADPELSLHGHPI